MAGAPDLGSGGVIPVEVRILSRPFLFLSGGYDGNCYFAVFDWYYRATPQRDISRIVLVFLPFVFWSEKCH